jgi:hypothetical protein
MEKTIITELSQQTGQNDNLLIVEPQTREKTKKEENLPFVKNPNLNNLKYCDRKISLKTNLYKIKLNKNYTLYEYAVKFQHDDPNLSAQFKQKILSKQFSELNKIYGMFFLSGGDVLFSNKLVLDVKNVLSVYKKFKYSILICPTKQKIELNELEEETKKRPALKCILELIIKDILKSNPKVKFMKNMYTMKDDKKSVKSYENSLTLFPGFSTKVLFLEGGFYLNVDIKNKISSSSNCLQLIASFIKSQKKVTQKEKEDVNKYFKSASVELEVTGQKFKIESVNFDRTPNTYSINFESNIFI